MRFFLPFLATVAATVACSEGPKPTSELHSIEEASARCQSNWVQWLADYAGANPYSSLNRTNQWKIEQSKLDQLLSGNGELEFREPIRAEEEVFQSLDISKSTKARNMSPRDRQISDALERLVKENPSSNLLIAHAGLIHTLDYFFLAENAASANFASYPFNESSRFESPDIYRFFEALGSPNVERAGSDYSAINLFGAYARFFHHSSQGRQPNRMEDFLWQAADPDSNILMIQDYHGIRYDILAAKLPSPQCLREFGYSSVTFALESSAFEEGVDYSSNQVLDQISFERKLENTGRINTVKQYRKAYRILQSSEVENYPNLMALIEKGQEYEKAGLGVRWTGIE